MVPLVDATGCVPNRITRAAADVGECGAPTLRAVAPSGSRNGSASGIVVRGNSYRFLDGHRPAILIDLRFVPEPQVELADDMNSICGPSCAPAQTRHEVVALTNLLQQIQQEDRLRFASTMATQFTRILQGSNESHGMFEVRFGILSTTIMDALSGGLLYDVPSKTAIPPWSPHASVTPRSATKSIFHQAECRGRQFSAPSAADTASPREPTMGQRTLTARERDVLAMFREGFTNKRIARNLEISPETVKSHVKRIFSELSARTRTEAVSRASSLGLI